MGQGKKQKGKSGKAREKSRREEPDTARAGEADEQVKSLDTHSLKKVGVETKTLLPLS